jgi:glycosyltransferase involved in cell wall biosynthesis
MGYPNDIESILESARILADRKDIHFLLIGSGAKKRWIEKFILTNDLQNVTILPNRPRSDQPNFLNACDVAIITLVSGMVGISMPSRTYNTLASGKPMIGVVDTDSELARVIEEERVGWVVPPSNPEKLVQAILEARSNHTQLSEMGARARLAAERKYPLDKIIEAYLAMIRGLEHSQPEHLIGQEPVR